MNHIQSQSRTHLKTFFIGIVIAVFVLVSGFASSTQAATQNNTQAINEMYTCIDRQTKRAQANSSSPKAENKFRNILRKETLEGIKQRTDNLNDKKFSNAAFEQEYQKINNMVQAGNKKLGGNKVIKPDYHLVTIKTERDNLLTQLNRRSEIAKNPSTPIDQLITNHCEMSWGLRANAAAGRKWRAQVHVDSLRTRNAVAKAYWVAAQRPAGSNPAQFDTQINQLQRHLDALTFPRTGIVGVSTLNPKNGDTKGAFGKYIYEPQKQLQKKVTANSEKLKKSMTPKPIKPTNKRNGYVQLPANNSLYYFYGSEMANTGDGGSTPSYQRYGKPALVMMFQNVAIKWNKMYPDLKLVAGDLNAVEGHASHKTGVDMDVYVQDRKAADMRGKHRNNASIKRTIELGKLFMDTKKIDVIFYNDPAVINQVNAYAKRNNLPGRMEKSNATHEFHFHVRIKGKAGSYDDCAKATRSKTCSPN